MRKPLVLVPALLLAGCHSQQVAFQFQPAPSTAVAVAAPPAPNAPLAKPLAEASISPVVAASPAKPARRLRPRHLVAALKALPPATLAQVVAPTLAEPPQPRHPSRRHTTEGAAESGLGNIGLFVIGVVLAILAGLAALFALIPGVSFWGGLGLAVGALVVLFLLYSLVSGGKKKKA
ncbi:hypothetical protein GKZ68_16050 [Hymenobacter sp. BRD128]|uniref:hypothetical protein n=1 Tax=Hymenobacter sp. BRD128 TaxID=2675878 RepID=UPI00156466F1|nr:hypothetical protein [Hymenobacter sp. BRD128]QKG57998.1 hypothetical protein GKZ68_16050 [Hymenobacter sp. BRD128]